MRVQLICENVNFEDVEFELASEPLVLGRSRRADVQVLHPLISRLHCEWTLQAGEVMVRDLESTNQTFINGEPTRQTVLQPGDRILLGDVLYIVEFVDRREGIADRHPGESCSHFLLNDSQLDSEAPTTRMTVENAPLRRE